MLADLDQSLYAAHIHDSLAQVLMNVAEADLPADPLYGELTTAG